MPVTEVILSENIPGLGAEADQVKVKAGYARNYLVPGRKALLVTPQNMKKLNQLKAKRAEREAAELNDAQALSKKINKLKIEMLLETGKSGKAFGSITARDLSEKLKAEGIEVDHHKFELDGPIKTTGVHEIPVKLHADVATKLTLTVKSSTEPEAEAQDEEAPKSKTRK